MDTDSISFCKPDHSPFTEEEQQNLLNELNSLYPEKIKWDHDGIYDVVVIVRAKNYILKKDGKVIKKGSALKSSKTEPKMKEFINEIIEVLLEE